MGHLERLSVPFEQTQKTSSQLKKDATCWSELGCMHKDEGPATLEARSSDQIDEAGEIGGARRTIPPPQFSLVQLLPDPRSLFWRLLNTFKT